jgi:hypothetical protein
LRLPSPKASAPRCTSGRTAGFQCERLNPSQACEIRDQRPKVRLVGELWGEHIAHEERLGLQTACILPGGAQCSQSQLAQ